VRRGGHSAGSRICTTGYLLGPVPSRPTSAGCYEVGRGGRNTCPQSHSIPAGAARHNRAVSRRQYDAPVRCRWGGLLIQERLRGLLGEDDRVNSVGEGVIPTASSRPGGAIAAPGRPEHGDFSTKVALALSGQAADPSRAAGDRIVQALPEAGWGAKVTVRGPGSVNIRPEAHMAARNHPAGLSPAREDYGRW